MRCGYFDCFSGAAGDMILAALVHAGLELEILRALLPKLGLTGVQIDAQRVQRGGLAATHVEVRVDPQAACAHRHLPDILGLIDRAGLPERVAARARRVFTRLAEAEAAVHGVDVGRVHFHEVGAADAIVDVVGACVGIDTLGLERIICSPIPTGTGTVRCAHGVLPLPAPATAELLRGVPLAACDEPAELTTPTGAALLTTLAEGYGPVPAMRVESIGYGAGMREGQTRPNVLRLLVGELDETVHEPAERIVVLETQVDDATGQTVAHALGRALEAGALDAFAVPILMKKGRPGQLLTVLCQPADADALAGVLFRETTTFGVRRHECIRSVLARAQVTVTTPFGSIRVKVGTRGGETIQAWPEYEDCAAAARAHGVALRTVQEAARREWVERHADRDAGDKQY